MPSSKIYTTADSFPIETEHGRLTMDEGKIVLPEQKKDNVTLKDVEVSKPDKDGNRTVAFKWTYRYWLRRDDATKARYIDCAGEETLDLNMALTALVQKASHSAKAFNDGAFTVVTEGERGKVGVPDADALKTAIGQLKSADGKPIKGTSKTTDGSFVEFTPEGLTAGWDKLAKAQQAFIAKLGRQESMF